MSVMLYEDKKFQRIAATLKVKAGNFPAYLFDYPNPKGRWDNIERFVQKLCLANTQAWNERYDENEEYRSIDFEAPVDKHYTDVELIKSLAGIKYNTVESVDFEKVLEKLRDLMFTLMYQYLQGTEEWEEAKTW